MNNLMKIITMFFLLTTISFAQDDVTTTSSSVTKTVTAPPTEPVPSVTTPGQSTSYTTTTTTTSTGNPRDDDIVAAVYTKYAKDSALIGTALTVKAKNGVVTVSGSVTAQSQADEAEIAAKAVPGVKDVISEITVATNPGFNKKIETPNY